MAITEKHTQYDNDTHRLILKSPNGKLWQITVSDAGAPVIVDTGETG